MPDTAAHTADVKHRLMQLEKTNSDLEAELRHLRRARPILIRSSIRAGVLGAALTRASSRYRLKRNVEELETCGLFDPAWYEKTYPDVADAAANPALHFLMYGADELRDPGPEFDTAFYVQTYPDVAKSGLNPVLHYVRFGHAEQRLIRSVGGDFGRRSESASIACVRHNAEHKHADPLARYADPDRYQVHLCVGPCKNLVAKTLRVFVTRATLLTELALRPPGVLLIDWVGLQHSQTGEWAALWRCEDMRLNRHVMDACRIALERGWRIRVYGPVLRSDAPLFQTVADVVEVITPKDVLQTHGMAA